MYIGGTVHMLRPNTVMPLTYDKIFNRADVLVFEADYQKLTSPVFAQKLQQRALLNPPQTLKTLISVEAYQALTNYCQRNQLPLFAFDKTQPSLVALQVTLMKLQQMGYTESGVDAHYFNRGFAQNKALRFLETPEFQLDLMLSLGRDDPSAMILYTLSQMDSYQQLMADTIRGWRSGDERLMIEALINPMKTEDPKGYQQLLTDRNTAWMEQLVLMLNDPLVEFVLVGAAHLYGSDSVIAYMKQNGFSVEQLD